MTLFPAAAPLSPEAAGMVPDLPTSPLTGDEEEMLWTLVEAHPANRARICGLWWETSKLPTERLKLVCDLADAIVEVDKRAAS